MSRFKVGDKVRVVEIGCGCGFEDYGKEVTITELGWYNNGVGYKVYPAIGNTKTLGFNGFIGEDSFEPLEASKRHKHYDMIVAWAENPSLEFQCRHSDDSRMDSWEDCEKPMWFPDVEYRIKPEKSEREIEIEKIQEEMEKLEKRLEQLKDSK